MTDLVPKNQSTPEFLLPDLDMVRHMEDRLAEGLAPVWVADGGETITVADGRVFMWFQTQQKVGNILRREYRLTWADGKVWQMCAVHFKVLGKARYEAVKAVAPRNSIKQGGFWYAVHGD